jgi:hypothetical protein
MALRKTITIYNGEQTEYHRIIALELDTISEDAKATLASFHSYDVRAVQTLPPQHKEVFPFIHKANGNPYEEAYAAIKQDPRFEGAEDV